MSPHICIGAREDAKDAARLKEIGVTHILNCAKQLSSAHLKEFVHEKLDILGELPYRLDILCQNTEYQ